MKKRTLGILLALLLCLGLLTAGAAASSGGSGSAGGGEHTHYLCGGDSCTETLHSCEKVTFEPWTKSGLPDKAGNWYLTKDVTITSGWTPKTGTVLCLNGHTITRTSPSDSDEAAIHVTGEFTLTDCQDKGKLTAGQAFRGPQSGVWVRAGGTFNLYGGDITGISTGGTAGAGVRMGESSNITSAFNMYGGSITNNKVGAIDGGGVEVGDYDTFNMYGGVISGNTAMRDGGGVRVIGIFNMYGGEISGNSAREDGGGVGMFSGGRFTMTGGIITGNNASRNGGGVDAVDVTVSGTAKIVGNVVGGTKNEATGLYEGGTSSDLYVSATVSEEKALAIGTLSKGASIGIMPEINLSIKRNILATCTSDKLRYFFLNVDGYALEIESGNLVVNVKEYHYHPVCGAGCTHTDPADNHSSDSVVWTGVSSYDDLRTATGKYLYLKNDITLPNLWKPASGTVLCLNGKKLTASSTAGAIAVESGKSFTLCDCQNKGVVTSTSTGIIVNVSSGYTSNYTTFTMYGGKLVGNSQQKDAAVVYMNAPYSGGQTIFNLYGGTISGNTSYNDGAGVRNNAGTFNMYGGTISGNTVKTASSSCSARGAGVYNNGTFTMTGGTITGNTASGSGNTGGGVYNGGTTMRVSGKVNITGNTGGNVYLANGKTITIGTGGLDKSAKIGVTAQGLNATDRTYVIVATGANNGYYDNIFNDWSSSNEKWTSTRVGDNVYLSYGPLHIHDGNLCEPISSENELNAVVSGKYYYLKNDVTIQQIWTLSGKNIHLCLNGYSLISQKPSGETIKLTNSASLTIYDCNKSKKGEGWIKPYDERYIGRGVTVTNGCTFTLEGGTIIGNNASGSSVDANRGGGVYVAAGGKFIMNGGTIEKNTAFNGCGVFVYGTFEMNGGEIAGNYGSGVYVDTYTDTPGTMTVSGEVRITGNKAADDSEETNVYLKRGSTIAIGTAGLNDASRIGVSAESTPQTIVTGATDGGAPYTTIFTSDSEGDKLNGFYVIYRSGTDLVLGRHTHAWKFTANGATVTAECSEEGTPCSLNNNGGSITIVKPEHAKYGDGLAANATLTGSFNDAVGATVGNITYYKGTEELGAAAPTDAGEYTAKLTVSGQTIQVEYEIKQATLTESDFTFALTTSDLTYDGNAKTGTVTGPTGVSFTWKYYDENGNKVEPINVGDYTVKVSVSGNANYENAVLTSDNWKFTIGKRMVEILWKNLNNRVFGDGKTVTAEVLNKCEGDDVSIIVTGGDATAVGPHTATAVRLEGAHADNYKLPSHLTQDYYTINKAPTEVVGEPKAVPGLTYTGQAQELITTDGVSAKDGHGTVVYSLGGTNYDAAIPTGTDAKTYTVYYKVQGDANYSDSAVNSVTVTIGWATITVTPTAEQSKVYGQNDPALTYSYTGAEANETPAFDGALTRAAGDNVDTYVISQGNLALKDNGSFKANNYKLVVATGVTFKITRKALTVSGASVADKTYDGNVDATVTGVTFDGLVNGESVEYAVVSAAFPDKDADDANVNVTITVSLKGDVAKNYMLTNGTDYVAAGAAKIDRKALTVSGVTVADKTYDGSANATVNSSTMAGAVDGEAVDYTVTGVFADKNAAAGKTVNLTYELTDAAKVNYYIDTANSQKTATATIKQKEVHITGITANSREYDGTTEANSCLTDGYTLYGKVDGDDVGVDITAEFADANVIERNYIKLSYTLTGGDKDNYVVDMTKSNQTAAAKIKPKKLTITDVTVADKIYDGTNTATITGVTFDGLVNGETLTVGDDYTVEGKFAFNYVNVPGNTVQATVTLTSSDTAKNYTFMDGKFPTVKKDFFKSAAIAPADQPISANTVHSAYGDTDRKVVVSGVQEDAVLTFVSSNQNIVDVDENGQLTFKKSGTAEITVTAAATDNYKEKQISVTVAVKKKDIRIAALDRTAYVGSAPDLSAPTLDTDYEIIGLVDGDDLDNLTFAMHYEAEDENGNRTPILPADMTPGTYIIVIELVSGTDDRYAIPPCDAGTLTLDAIPAYTVKVNDTEHGTAVSNRRSAVRGQTVTITVTPDEGYVLAALTVTDRSGKTITLTDKGDGKYTFKMPGSRVTVSASFRRLSVFTDIDNAWYTDDILWAEEMNIALDEDGSGLFRPKDDCSRAAIVTFLWRAFGSPEPTVTECPFTDVKESDPWYKAVLWAYENKITDGYGDPTIFAPDATSERAQTLTFLKRAVKAADVTTGNDFTDVPEGAWYEAAVNWAVSEGLTNGYDDPTIFAPREDCSRAEIIAFIHRLLAK